MKIKKIRTEAYLQPFRKLISDLHKKDCFVIFTDGSGDNMHQEKAIKFGFLIYETGKLLHSASFSCYDTFNTSVKSEIMAVNAALQYLVDEKCCNVDVVVLSDNKFLVDWCINNRNWYSSSTEKSYYSAFVVLRELIKQFKSVQSKWIARECNTLADNLTR
jgi:ribonuclease HI